MSDGIRVVIFGASGLAGGETLLQLLADERIAQVIAVGRRHLPSTHAKLESVTHSDFLDFEPLAEKLTGIDACFWELGVSQNDVPDEQQYTEITYGYTMAAAAVIKRVAPGCVWHFISGSGTNESKGTLWRRVKGRTERELMEYGFPRVICYRPGLIWTSPGRKPRYVMEKIVRPFKFLLYPLKSASINGADYGRVSLRLQFSDYNGIIENAQMRRIAAQPDDTKIAL